MRRRAHRDPVKPEDVRTVMRRDDGCLMAQFDRLHVCRDTWGVPHAPDALHLLSIEHVKPELAMGRRGPSDPRWMVALCHGANVAVPSKDARDFFRRYLEQHAA